MRNRLLAASVPFALLLAGCSGGHSGSHATKNELHVGSIPKDDFRTAPLSSMGPGMSYEWDNTGKNAPPPPGNGNPGPIPPSGGGSGNGSSGSIHIGGKPG